MNKMLNLAAGAAAAVGMTLHAETSIRIENGTEKPVTPCVTPADAAEPTCMTGKKAPE